VAASNTINLIIALKDEASNRARKLQGTLDGVSGTVFNLQNALAGLGVGAAAASLTRTFAEFDDKIRQVGAVAGATKEELTLLSDTAEEMGATTRFAASEAADGLKFLSMAGFDTQEAITALPKTLQLASAGAVELGQAADIATNIMASYSMKAEDLGHANDVLTKAFTSTNATLEELGTAFTYVGPVAAGLGTEFENLVGALGSLHSAGIKGSMAGTTLRGVLDAMFNPTAEEAEQMKVLSDRIGGAGLQIKDASGDFVGFTELVRQLEDAGMTADEALKLFGQRAGPGMQALLGQGSAALEELDEKLRNSGGTAQRIAEEMESGIGGAIRSLMSAFEGLKIAFAGIFEEGGASAITFVRDEITGLTEKVKALTASGALDEWMNRIAEAASKVWGVLKTTAGVIAGVVDALEPFIKRALALAPALIAIAVASKGVSVALGAATAAASAFSVAANFSVAGTKITGLLVLTQGLSKELGIMTLAAKGFGKSLISIKFAAVAVGGALAAMFAGWQIGKFIGELKLFEDGTVSVNEKVQDLYAWFGRLGDDDAFEKQQDKLEGLMARVEEYKNFEMPDDFASGSIQDLEELGGKIRQARSYWQLYLQKQEEIKAKAIADGEKSAALAAGEAIEEAKEKLGKYKDMMGQVEDARAKKQNAAQIAIDKEKAALAELIKFNEQAIKIELDQLETRKQHRIEKVNEALEQEKISVEEAEQKKAEIAEEYIEKTNDARLAHVEQSAQEELDARLSILEKEQAQEIKHAKAVMENEELLARAIINIKKKYADEEAQIRAAALEKVAKEEESQAQEALARFKTIEEKKTKEASAAMKIRLAEVEKLENQGILAAEDAAEQKIEIEEKYLESMLEKREQALDMAADAYGKDSEEYSEAMDAKREAEVELVEFQAEAEKMRAKAVEDSQKEILDILRNETQLRAAEHERLIAQIEIDEARGVISAEEAARKKMDAEVRFAEFKVAQARRAVEEGIQEYSKDSQEYQNMVAEKIKAETELLKVKEKREQASETAAAAEEKSAQATEEAAVRIAASVKATGDQLDKIIDKKQKVLAAGGISLIKINYDEAENTLGELDKILDEAAKDMQRFNDSHYMAPFAKDAAETAMAIEGLKAEFKALAIEAQAAGVSIEMSDMTLEEAAAAVEQRTTAWKEFTGAIGDTSQAFADLSNSPVNIQTDDLESARTAFAEISKEAAGMGDKIAEVNALISQGDMEAAQEMADNVIGSYETIYDRASEYIGQLKEEWQTLYDKVAEITGKIAELNQTTEQRIRELRRETMTEEQAFLDRKLEYQETYAAAVEASNAGQFEQAEKLFNESMKLAESLAEEVKNGNGEIVSTLEENTAMSIQLMEQTRAAAEESLLGYQDQLKGSMAETEETINTVTSSVDALGASMKNATAGAMALNKSLKTGANYNVEFTGTGSDRKPIMDKMREIASTAKSTFDGVNNAAANIDFSNIRRGIESVAEAAREMTVGAAGSVNRSGISGTSPPGSGAISL